MMLSSAALEPKRKRRRRPEAVAQIGHTIWSPPDDEKDGRHASELAAQPQCMNQDFADDIHTESRFLKDGPELRAPIPFGVSRNAVPEVPEEVFLWYPHMPRPLFQSSYFPPLPTSRSSAPLVPQDIPRRHVDPSSVPYGDEEVDAMARLIDCAAGRPVDTDPDDTFYQHLVASEQVDLLWPYHYPSRNVPIPAQSYDAVMHARFGGADTADGAVSFSDIADTINQQYASVSAPHVSYMEQAVRGRLCEGPLPNWLQTPYGTSLVTPVKYSHAEILKHGVEWTKNLEAKTAKLHDAIRHPKLTPLQHSGGKGTVSTERGALQWLGKLFEDDAESEDVPAAPEANGEQAQGWFGNWW